MATTDSRIAVVDVEQLSASAAQTAVNAAIEVLEAAGFVVTEINEQYIDKPGNPKHTFSILGVLPTHLAAADVLTTLASTANGEGASLLGLEDAAGNLDATNAEAGIAEIFTKLAGVLASQGAHLVGYQDANGKTTAATVNAALDELYSELVKTTNYEWLLFGGNWYEIDGTPLVAFADGASPTPGLALDNSKAAGIRWNDHANPDPITTTFAWPDDINESQDATLVIRASKSGATLADAVTFDVEAFQQVTGALADADADFGGTSSAMTGDAAAKTVQEVSLTLGNEDISPGALVTLTLQPTDGTIGTDDVTVHGVGIKYTSRMPVE